MKMIRIALQNKSSRNIPYAALSQVAQALQTQIDRDFGPIWGIHAQITALQEGDTVPALIWLMTILDHSEAGLGVHLDKSHHPFAEIEASDDWTITASHEMLEMLCDPLGHKFMQAPDITPNSDGHLVNYLVEVGDPCEIYSYTINNVTVSDFVTPDYYNPHADGSVSLDFLHRLSQPFEVPQGCYLSWIDPADGKWHQKQVDGSFVSSRERASTHGNPRQDRDDKIGDGDGNADARHNLSAIRSRFINNS